MTNFTTSFLLRGTVESGLICCSNFAASPLFSVRWKQPCSAHSPTSQAHRPQHFCSRRWQSASPTLRSKCWESHKARLFWHYYYKCQGGGAATYQAHSKSKLQGKSGQRRLQKPGSCCQSFHKASHKSSLSEQPSSETTSKGADKAYLPSEGEKPRPGNRPAENTQTSTETSTEMQERKARTAIFNFFSHTTRPRPECTIERLVAAFAPAS